MKALRIVGGLLFLFLIIVVVAFAGHSLYRLFFPRSDVLLSIAVRVADQKAIGIEGRAYVAGGPAMAGRVKITVRGFFPARRVTLIQEIKDGGFFVPPSPSLSSFESDDRIVVDAEAQVPADKATLTGQEYALWNIGRWVLWLPQVALPGCLILALLLSVLFTGDYTPLKNRVAISLTYVTIALFLLVPFLLPLAINWFPEVKAAMAGSPVGFVQIRKARGLELNEWALNIGGALEKATESSYDVTGGLVVPLYVLILATLGGVINMTRKVPKLQADIEAQIKVPFGMVHMAIARVLSPFRGPDARSAAKGSGEDLPSGGTSNEAEAPSQAAPADLSLADRQAKINLLRGDLINQYMYLITAPFLAMVVYYLLFVVDENLAKRSPIVVLVSFSAGLMSESVLRTITGYADLYLSRLLQSLQKRKEDSAAQEKPNQAGKPKPGTTAPTG